jgi:hypothetical protein
LVGNVDAVERRFRPSKPRNTKSGAALPTMLIAAASDAVPIASPRIRPPASTALRMRCNAQNDAVAPRLINHAGNPAVPDLSLGRWVPYRKLCALAFRRVCPDQTLCKIAQCEPQCQRNDCAFTGFLYDLAHIRAISFVRGNCGTQASSPSTRFGEARKPRNNDACLRNETAKQGLTPPSDPSFKAGP